jgi:5-methylcytosine-specific restriction enzyme A
MAVRAVLEQILTEYHVAVNSPFGGNLLAQFIRRKAADAIVDALGDEGVGLIVQGSPGQGQWAAVPWISVFDPAITTGATRGYYVVYLFHAGRGVVHLSLNQGTTAVRDEFASKARVVLAERAELIRKRLFDFSDVLSTDAIDLGSDAGLPGDYVAGHALGATYTLADLPDEIVLRNDLRAAVSAYRALTYRGGMGGDLETHTELANEFEISSQSTITEIRRYSYHRKIERNSTAAKSAKRLHGTRCQACDLDFSERYGEIGSGFIEAHHLRPIASLTEGIPVQYDLASEFAVLCANCHRMIHRTSDHSDLAGFRENIREG